MVGLWLFRYLWNLPPMVSYGYLDIFGIFHHPRLVMVDEGTFLWIPGTRAAVPRGVLKLVLILVLT